MRVKRYLTELELLQVEGLANVLACQLCRADAGVLRGIVRDYVGQADAAEGAVFDRCVSDPAYLASVVQSYISDLDQPGLLEFLGSMTEPSAVVKQLGFNPFDHRRLEAYRLSHRFFNHRNQVIAMLIFAGVLCLTMLFPPWQMVRRERNDPCATLMCQPDRTVEVRFAGYHFISSPPVGDGVPLDVPQGTRATYITFRLYGEMLLLQWLGLFVVFVAASVAMRDRRSFDERVAAFNPGSSSGSTPH